MHHPTDRIAHTTAFVTPVVDHWLEREIAQWVHPTKDRSDDSLHHERTLLSRSYISLQNQQKNPARVTCMFCLMEKEGNSSLTVSPFWSMPIGLALSDSFIYLEERSSTSVWALSVYSDNSPYFGGVQSFCSRKEIFGRRDVVESFTTPH